jgi:chromobox protein 1
MRKASACTAAKAESALNRKYQTSGLKNKMDPDIEKAVAQAISNPPAIPKTKPPAGFARGLEAEAVLGATDASGELCYLIKWNGCKELDLVPAREANKKCPQVVISFYESKLVTHNQPA